MIRSLARFPGQFWRYDWETLLEKRAELMSICLAARPGPDQPMYGLQARGLDGQEAPRTAVEEMAAHYLDEIRSVQPHGPYFLGGQCFGGMVALEMARQLQAEGERVGLLAMFDDYAPGYTRLLSPAARARLWGRWLIWRGGVHLTAARDLGFSAWPGYVGQRAATIGRRFRSRLWAARSRRYDGRDGELPRELRDMREAHRHAQRTYLPRQFVGKPILFMVDNARDFLPDPDPLWGWGALASDGIALHDVPGDHDSLWEEPHVATLAEKLRAALDAARG